MSTAQTEATEIQLALSAIQFDKGTQCRAAMDESVVDEYAAAMKDGAEFPDVEVFGTAEACWLGDGWYRSKAAEKAGMSHINARLHAGGRHEAVVHALRANSTHGLRRTNADRRRAVEVALSEFPERTSRAIADLCGVGHQLVEDARQVDESPTCRTPAKRIGRDGKQYPAPSSKSPRTAGKAATSTNSAGVPLQFHPEVPRSQETDFFGSPKTALQIATNRLCAEFKEVNTLLGTGVEQEADVNLQTAKSLLEKEAEATAGIITKILAQRRRRIAASR